METSLAVPLLCSVSTGSCGDTMGWIPSSMVQVLYTGTDWYKGYKHNRMYSCEYRIARLHASTNYLQKI